MRIRRTNKYDDIIDLPYVKSVKRPHMSREDRAAQFAPFAALTGHKEAVDETARETEKRRILDEQMKIILDAKFGEIMAGVDAVPMVEVVHFTEDELKAGGRYVSHQGYIKKIDEIEKMLIFEDNTHISIDDVWDINIKGE